MQISKEFLLHLASLDKEIGPLRPDSINNYYQGAKYLSYPALKRILDPILAAFDLKLIHALNDGVLTTRLYWLTDKPEYIETSVDVSTLKPEKGNPAHGLASAVTYFRRYNIYTLLDIAIDDDDGNGVMPIKSKDKPGRVFNLESAIKDTGFNAWAYDLIGNGFDVLEQLASQGFIVGPGDRIGLIKYIDDAKSNIYASEQIPPPQSENLEYIDKHGI